MLFENMSVRLSELAGVKVSKCALALTLCMVFGSCTAESPSDMGNQTHEEAAGLAQPVESVLPGVSASGTSDQVVTSTVKDAVPMLTTDESRFVEGKHYKVLKGMPKFEATEKVSVQEFFSYGCPHCYRMESTLNQWHKKGHAALKFERVPAFWNPYFQKLAQAFYTMQILGLEETLHAEIFDALHVRRENLQSDASIQALFVKAGVSEEDFKKTYTSFTVQQKVGTARSLFNTFGLSSVPVFVINSRYVTDISMAGSPQAVTEIIDYLVRKIKIATKS